MDLYSNLNISAISRTSTVIEKSICSSLLNTPKTKVFLSEVKTAATIYVRLPGVTDEFSRRVIEHLPQPVSLFPLSNFDIGSPIPIDCASTLASIVAEFLRKILHVSSQTCHGVFVLTTGATVDGFSTPGALAWKMLGNSSIKVCLEDVETQISSAHLNMFSESIHNHTIYMSEKFTKREVTINQLVEMSKSLIESRTDDLDVKEIKSLVFDQRSSCDSPTISDVSSLSQVKQIAVSTPEKVKK